MNNPTPTQIIDTAGNTHMIEITVDGIMLDGKPCRLVIKETQIVLMTADPARGLTTIAPAAFWHAFAGSDPTPESAGLIQAHALAHWSAMQEISLTLLRLYHLVDDMDRQLHHFSEAPLPAYRFDPFTLQLLRTYDGTAEHIAALARLLKQPSETICSWLASIGLTATLDHEGRKPSLLTVASTGIAMAGPPAPAQNQPKTFRWTPFMIQQLTETFFASDEPSISAVSRTIAEKYGWPIQSIEYKIYHLDLPREREQNRQQQQREPEEQALQEESPVAVEPLPVAAEEKQSGSPLLLPAGAFLWDVKIAGTLQRWPLDIVYGMFPCAAGSHVVYREKVYVIQQVSTSVIAVTPVGTASAWAEEQRTVMQLATV